MQTDSRSRGQSESYSQNNQRLGRELMTPSELATMPGDKCILQLRGLPPFFSSCLLYTSPDAVETSAQKQEVVQIPFWETEQDPSEPAALPIPSVCLEMQGIRVEIHEQAGADVIRNTLLALRQLC